MKDIKNLVLNTSLSVYLAYRRLLPTSDSPGSVLLPRLAFSSIVIGVAASILILSLANGLHYNFLNKLAESDAHLTIVSVGKGIPAYQEVIQKITLLPGITQVFPFSQNEAIIKFYEETAGVLLKSYPNNFNNDPTFNELFKLIQGRWCFSEPRSITIGESLARDMAIFIGDAIDILVYDHTLGAITYRFKVSGIFSAGDAFLNRGLTFINFQDAAEIFGFENYAPAIGIRVKEKLSPEQYIPYLEQITPFHCKTWKSANLNTLIALDNEKKIIQVILFIFFCVVFFGILSVMTALVTDKREEIALLRALGMTSSENIKSFMLTGLYLGISASAVGVCVGTFLSLTFNYIIKVLEWSINIILQFIGFVMHSESTLSFSFLNQTVYYLKEFPIQIQIADILFSCLLAISCTLLAAIYPAYLSQYFKPAEILRKRAF